MKTIVIPSDFSLDSVQVAEAIVRNEKNEVRIIFTHLFYVADDIQDLLFLSYRKKEYEFVSDEFNREVSILKSMHPHLVSVKTEFFYGGKLAGFKNFLDYNEADGIAYSESYGIPKLSKSSIDAMPVLRKSGIRLINTDAINEAEFADMGQEK
ncbi:hypothetical protein [Dyadobacter sp. CY312]|uniref:hypothetical protein n=1 Tax=Dyadobacter sp. CY312 TaxID=2907303 RepID=UPI001F44D558|nr:hypothetical protein [Dyadobacter sp. CY312]MCE7043519.1 hypothetical protein [Dyadobacter sp. CY312]